MLDLRYNLPVQVRDSLKIQNEEKHPQDNITLKSFVSKEFALSEAKKNDKLQNIMSVNCHY